MQGKFKEILNSSPNPVIICDENHVIDTVNLALCKEFGYQMNELIGEKIHQLIPVFEEGIENVEKTLKCMMVNLLHLKKIKIFYRSM